jgi:hypothetical protein
MRARFWLWRKAGGEGVMMDDVVQTTAAGPRAVGATSAGGEHVSPQHQRLDQSNRRHWTRPRSGSYTSASACSIGDHHRVASIAGRGGSVRERKARRGRQGKDSGGS